MDAPYQLNAPFLADLFVDDALLYWNPPASASDLAKRVIDVFRVFQEEPTSVTREMVAGIAAEPNSQIQRKEQYLEHIHGVGTLYRVLCDRLLKQDPALDLPPPDEAYVHGLLHDFSALYSDYKKTGQESKEIDLYFHARHLGVEKIARHVAMHGAYLELLELLYEGAVFPHAVAYTKMHDALQDGLHHKIQQEFVFFRRGQQNLPLMALTLADYLASPRQLHAPFVLNHIDEYFAVRTSDLVRRYHTLPRRQEQMPSALGLALVEKNGLVRAGLFKERIKKLLRGKTGECERLRHFAPGLWEV
ncbi:MAG: hypothetical protein Q7R76_01400 [Candidatus Woesearchaeota archaeon]|nr:hypothetical protein [Candidatus Woesearchaeota archaeon]